MVIPMGTNHVSGKYHRNDVEMHKFNNSSYEIHLPNRHQHNDNFNCCSYCILCSGMVIRQYNISLDFLIVDTINVLAYNKSKRQENAKSETQLGDNCS